MLKLNNLLASSAIALTLAILPVGYTHAGFEEAVKAYEAGDYETALKEWMILAQKNDPAAMRNIGHLYRRGLGTEQSYEKAMHWYKRASSFGFARAQANVASMYLRGQGVEQDYVQAADWFTKAARNGHVIAQYNLGLMYEHGKGVEKSVSKALAGIIWQQKLAIPKRWTNCQSWLPVIPTSKTSLQRIRRLPLPLRSRNKMLRVLTLGLTVRKK
ncbi:tetratricopeptide repeat protein [Sneathiella glossodoripedis]|uniref:tetratricopeptide repeat protein n=1 Tax=Sneathiella glossodoripedis TaxID=418853 RepID=UPI000687ACC2|nr:tetratricopeptide repeat protein [Sneathiella glossodoripedis]